MSLVPFHLSLVTSIADELVQVPENLTHGQKSIRTGTGTARKNWSVLEPDQKLAKASSQFWNILTCYFFLHLKANISQKQVNTMNIKDYYQLSSVISYQLNEILLYIYIFIQAALQSRIVLLLPPAAAAAWGFGPGMKPPVGKKCWFPRFFLDSLWGNRIILIFHVVEKLFHIWNWCLFSQYCVGFWEYCIPVCVPVSLCMAVPSYIGVGSEFDLCIVC